MSEDMKDSAEESETQKTEVKLSELSADNITDEFVDEVSETLLEGEENIAGDVELQVTLILNTLTGPRTFSIVSRPRRKVFNNIIA